MRVLDFAAICFFGLCLYLSGTGAVGAALVLSGAAAFYLAITMFLMRE